MREESKLKKSVVSYFPLNKSREIYICHVLLNFNFSSDRSYLSNQVAILHTSTEFVGYRGTVNHIAEIFPIDPHPVNPLKIFSTSTKDKN